MYISLIYSRATSYLNCFNVYIFAPYAFYAPYAFGSEALIRGWCGTCIIADAYKRKCGKAEDAKYS